MAGDIADVGVANHSVRPVVVRRKRPADRAFGSDRRDCRTLCSSPLNHLRNLRLELVGVAVTVQPAKHMNQLPAALQQPLVDMRC